VSPFVVLFVQNALIGCALNSSSLLPPYLNSLGAPQAYVGLYNVLSTLLIVVTVVFFGRYLVRLPRVRALRWSFFVLTGAQVAAWAFPPSLAALAVFKVLGAVAHITSSTLMTSLLLDVTPRDRRAGSLAVYSVAGIVTNPIASLLGEAVTRASSGHELFLLGAAFALAAWLWSWFLREPPATATREAPSSFLQAIRHPELGALVFLAFSFGTYFSALTAFLPGHTLQALGAANLSAFLIPFSVVSVLIRVFLGREMDRRPPRRFLSLSFGAISLALGLQFVPASWPLLVVSGLLYGVGHSILNPLLNALFVQVGGEQQKAVFSNAYLVASLSGAVLMTPLLGALGDLGGFASVLGVLTVMALGSFVLVRVKFPKPGVRRPATGRPSGRSS
jgi:predicted MFS family arabinose efflux permease